MKDGRLNPYSYQYEKVGEALRQLLLPDMPFDEKLAAAMLELQLAFRDSTPSGAARLRLLELAHILGDSGTWRERAARLNEEERRRAVDAFWALDRAVSRDYHTFTASQP